MTRIAIFKTSGALLLHFLVGDMARSSLIQALLLKTFVEASECFVWKSNFLPTTFQAVRISLLGPTIPVLDCAS